MQLPARYLKRAPRHASVGERVRYHFARIQRALEMLSAALLEIERRMCALSERYRTMMSPCRLVLYVKRLKGGRPQALYWGKTLRLEKEGMVHRYREHIPGHLKGKTIYRVAGKYSECEVFFDFERRRLPLNDDHAELAKAQGKLSNSLRFCKVEPNRRPPNLPPAVEGSTPEEFAWRVAWACAHVEDEMLRFVASVSVSPIFPYAKVGEDGYVSIGWAQPEPRLHGGQLRVGHRHIASQLSRKLLEQFGVTRSLWPQLRSIDWHMRRLRREHERYAAVIGRAKRVGRWASTGKFEKYTEVHGTTQKATEGRA